MPETKRYNKAQLMFGDLEIVCGDFKMSFKVDTTDLSATNSSTPYDTQFGDESIEAEASDIDPNLRKALKAAYEKQEKRTLASYDFDEQTGDLVEDEVLYEAHIKELSKESANKPFSVKFGANRYKKQE